MSNTGTAGENSTVNGYVLAANGNMPQTGSFGGPSRVFNATDTWLQDASGDANIGGNGTDFSKCVAYKVNNVGINAIIYMAGGIGGLQTLWRFEQLATSVVIQVGDGSGSFESHTLATGLSVGAIIGLGISFEWATKKIWGYLNGSPVFSGVVGTLRPGLTSCQVQVGGSGFGQIANGDIAAPTGWIRKLSDAEHALWWNSGNVRRLP